VYKSNYPGPAIVLGVSYKDCNDKISAVCHQGIRRSSPSKRDSLGANDDTGWDEQWKFVVDHNTFHNVNATCFVAVFRVRVFFGSPCISTVL